MSKSTKWRWLAVMLATLAVLVVAACGDDDEDGGGGGGGASADVEQFPADTTMGRIQEAGSIKVGVKYDVPPFGFQNPQTDEIEGFDVDLARAVADALGVELDPIEAISDNRIPFLMDGTADLILSTMTINTERDAEIDFSDPYFVARGRILVPGDSDIQGIDDLGGQKVCTAVGSTYEETLKEQAPDAELVLIDEYSGCLTRLQEGSVDAISTDDVILTGMIIQDDTLELVGDELTTEPYGAGIKDGDKEFQEFVNGVFEEYKSDPRWAESYEKWVGQYTGQEQEPTDLSLQEALEISG